MQNNTRTARQRLARLEEEAQRRLRPSDHQATFAIAADNRQDETDDRLSTSELQARAATAPRDGGDRNA